MKRTASLVIAAVLVLTGCAGPGGGAAKAPVNMGKPVHDGKEAVKMNYTLSEPVYPEFPQQPRPPMEGGEMDWEAYSEAYDKYMDALIALRGAAANVTEVEHAALSAFAARSATLVLEGHEGENAIYSPLSLWSALAMLAQCASGESRQQVLDAVGADTVDALQDQVEHVWRTLYTDDGISALILSNSIWLNSNLQGTYVQDTLDTLARKYYAGAYSAPMGTDAADEAVSNWVGEQTKGLIGGGQPVIQTDPETLALLVSSLYYKAAWTDKFPKEATEEDIFTGASGQESRTDFMHKTEDGNFIRREGYQAARLTTQLGEIVFVLPDEGVAPESLLEESGFLSHLEFYGDAALWGEVRWSVPKFDVNSELNLMEALKGMGIADLPDFNKADLTALTDLDAFLSDAKQLSRVKVDEEGVEAAAATMMMMNFTSMPPHPTEVCVMDLDRPFLFIIRTQDVPLFIGVVNHL